MSRIDESAVYAKLSHATLDELTSTLGPAQRARFDVLQGYPRSLMKCDQALLQAGHNLLSGNIDAFDNRLNALASCKSYRMNYVSAKIVAMSDARGSHPDAVADAVGYYRALLDSALALEMAAAARAHSYFGSSPAAFVAAIRRCKTWNSVGTQ
jgi:hypothetical protein